MAARNPNERVDAMMSAQALASSGVVNELLDQADSLLNRAVSNLRAGKLTDRDAAVVIATISELRTAADKANRQIIKGQEVGDSLTNTTTRSNHVGS